MAWKKERRTDTFAGSDAPFIAVTMSHFAFNAMFVRQSKIGPEHKVTIYTDEDERKIGFEFHKDERKDSYAISSQSAAKAGEKRQGMQCTSRAIATKYPWIEAVTKLKGQNNRFAPKKEGNFWVIQLCPAFENVCDANSKDISSNATGIYRYRRENGEIVYIGKGVIRQRASMPERKDWDFNKIEYSIIEDNEEQLKWEDYWIEKFKHDNQGKKPIYNHISGASKYREKTEQ